MGDSLGHLFIIFHKLWKPTELFLEFGLGSSNVHTVLNNEYMGFTEKMEECKEILKVREILEVETFVRYLKNSLT